MIKRYGLACIKYGGSCCGSIQEFTSGGDYIEYKDALETLCQWAMSNGLSTGHADTIEGLLDELSGQIDAKGNRIVRLLETLEEIADRMTCACGSHNTAQVALDEYEDLFKQARKMGGE